MFGSTLLVFGPEPLLSERAVTARVQAARKERPDAQVNRVGAGELNGNQLSEVTGGSLFSSDAITVIEDIGSTPPELIEQLLQVCTDTPDDLCLIVVHPGGMKGKGLLDRLKKAKLDSVEAASVKPWDVTNFVVAESRRLKITLRSDAAQLLVDAVGSDLRALVGALEQLRADMDGAEIDKVAISKYFAGRVEVTSFAVADAVIAGNLSLALEQLRWALGTGVVPVLVTSAMASGFRGLGRYLDARGQRMNDYDLAREIGVPPFKVKSFHKTSRGWTPGAISTAMQLIARADAEVKGAATDPHYALERLVLNLVGQRAQSS